MAKELSMARNNACNDESTSPNHGGDRAPTESPEDLNNPYQDRAGQCDAPGQAVKTWLQGMDVSPLLTHAFCSPRHARGSLISNLRFMGLTS